jgi:hypothetical protein
VATDGTLGTVWENRFPGAIDDVAIWRRLLTTGEVTSLYTRGLTGESAIGDPNHPLMITGIDLDAANNDATLRWNSFPGATYVVETSDDLVTWDVVVSGYPSGGESTTFRDSSIAAGTTRRFYRVGEE